MPNAGYPEIMAMKDILTQRREKGGGAGWARVSASFLPMWLAETR